MGSKRLHEEAEGQGSSAHNKKRKFDPSQRKPKHFHNSKASSDKTRDSNPLHPLRSRIRSLKRLLAHDDAVDAALLSRGSSSRATHQSEGQQLLHSRDELEIAAKHERRDEKRIKRLPAQVRLEHERELAGLEGKVAEIEAKKRRANLIGKWHMVRFFERRRAERVLKRLRKELRLLEAEREQGRAAGDGDQDEEVRGLTARIKEVEVARAYAVYFPLERPYVSLWPRRKGKDDGDGTEGGEKAETEGDGWEKPVGDAVMWALVRKCLKDGRLDDLREGRVEGSLPQSTSDTVQLGRSAQASAKGGKAASKSHKGGKHGSAGKDSMGDQKRVGPQDGSDDSDDGGFFEE